MCPHGYELRDQLCLDCASPQQLREHVIESRRISAGAELELLQDNARLRALIKAAEKLDRGDGYQWKCPWCGSVLGGDARDLAAEPHQDDCPAFTEAGEVR